MEEIVVESSKYFLFQFNLLIVSISLAWMLEKILTNYPRIVYRFMVLEYGLKELLIKIGLLSSQNQNNDDKEPYYKDSYIATLFMFIFLIFFLFIVGMFMLKIFYHLPACPANRLLITPALFIFVFVLFPSFLWHLLLGCCPGDIDYLIKNYEEWMRMKYGNQQVEKWKKGLKDKNTFRKKQLKYAGYKLAFLIFFYLIIWILIFW